MELYCKADNELVHFKQWHKKEHEGLKERPADHYRRLMREGKIIPVPEVNIASPELYASGKQDRRIYVTNCGYPGCPKRFKKNKGVEGHMRAHHVGFPYDPTALQSEWVNQDDVTGSEADGKADTQGDNVCSPRVFE